MVEIGIGENVEGSSGRYRQRLSCRCRGRSLRHHLRRRRRLVTLFSSRRGSGDGRVAVARLLQTAKRSIYLLLLLLLLVPRPNPQQQPRSLSLGHETEVISGGFGPFGMAVGGVRKAPSPGDEGGEKHKRSERGDRIFLSLLLVSPYRILGAGGRVRN